MMLFLQIVRGFSTLLTPQHRRAWHEMMPANRTEVAATFLTRVSDTAFRLGCHQQLLNDTNHSEVAINDTNIHLETFAFDQGQLSEEFVFPSLRQYKGSHIRFTNQVPMNKTQNCEKYVVSGVLYKEISEHLMKTDTIIGDKVNLASHLISFSLNNDSRRDLPGSTKVVITIEHQWRKFYGDRPRCVFWDYDRMDWSNDGCQVIEHLSFRNQTTCECNHLTNFAILMDVSNREYNDQGVKHVLSLCCSSISIVALSITILMLTLCKTMRNRRSVITTNLSFCLLVVNALVVGGLDQTDHVVLCRVLSGILLYFLLASFAWMLMEGYFLYQMIILVFQSVGHLKTKWLYTIGYIPAAIVVLVFYAVTGEKGFYDQDFGFL